MSSFSEYKGEDYDLNKKIIPTMPKIQQAYDPEVDTNTKTTVKILNSESEGFLMVDGVSPIGFTLNNGMKVLGPMALFAKSVFQWKVSASTVVCPVEPNGFLTCEQPGSLSPKEYCLIFIFPTKDIILKKLMLLFLSDVS